jgi:hypothetical protein
MIVVDECILNTETTLEEGVGKRKRWNSRKNFFSRGGSWNDGEEVVILTTKGKCHG